MSPEERGQVPGIKPERGDLILAGAFVIQTVMDLGAFDALEVTEAGLREGVFYSTLLEGRDPPLFEDVRRDAVLNLAAQYDADFAHVEHVARLALGMWDALGEAGAASRGPARARPAVGGRDAARHRHRGRLRRPPQALALPDPERGAARLHDARDGPDRADGALSPQGQPVARARRGARARRRRGHARPLLGAAAARRAVRALARPGGPRGDGSRSTTAGSRSARGRRGRLGRALGGPAPARPLRARVRQGAQASAADAPTRRVVRRGRGTNVAVGFSVRRSWRSPRSRCSRSPAPRAPPTRLARPARSRRGRRATRTAWARRPARRARPG